MTTSITWAQPQDLPEILEFIRELAEYEKLADAVVADESLLKKNLFGPQKYAEVIFIEENSCKLGFAIFFHNFSTFLGKPGIYLEDLYVKPEYRGKGHGKKLLSFLAKLTIERDCGRLEWAVLDWNKPAIDFYLSLGAQNLSDWNIYRLTGSALASLSKLI